MKVWILTEEINTGDSEHDTYVLSVHATKASADAAHEKAVTDAIDEGLSVYGENFDGPREPQSDDVDWSRSYEVAEWEVQP